MGKETKHSGTAHGKIILIGEHSVVHFKPAIALPLMSTEIRAEVSGNGSSADDPRFAVDCEYFTGSLVDAPRSLGNLQKLVAALFASLCVPQGCGGFDIKIISSIPRERGMGSSAAVAIAVIRAVADYAGVVLGSQEVFDYAQISENIAHENASGLDTIATASNQAVWFERGETAEAFD
ncbi:MAG: mevalonate kinase, partial [Scardovia wiggsiae]|nr:mevalonate kinase [Scardovia wiggsiae]